METGLVYKLTGAIIVGLLSMWIFDFGIIGGVVGAIAGWFLVGYFIAKL